MATTSPSPATNTDTDALVTQPESTTDVSTTVLIAQATPEEVETLSIGRVKRKPLGANQRCVSLILVLLSLVLFIFATEGTQWVRATGGMANGRPQCRFGIFETCDCIRIGQDNDELGCMRMNRRLDAAFQEDDDLYNDWHDEMYILRGLTVGTSICTALVLAFATWEKSDTSSKPRAINFKRIKLVAVLIFACAMLGVSVTRKWETNARLAQGMVNDQWAWGRDYHLWRAAWIMLIVAVPVSQFLE
eukprot:g27500.t1